MLFRSSKNSSDCLEITHEQIAKYMGSAREVVTRMLTRFSKEKLVTLKRGVIQILDKQSLKGIASDSEKL